MENDITKTKIVFVDDELNILKGLKRMLHPKRTSWDMQFLSTPQEALEVLKTQKVDVLISDMRMPGMDGAQLLSEARRIQPETVRIILSGYAEQDSLFRTIGPAHQFLGKPCSSELFVSTIERALSLHSYLSSQSLRKRIAYLESLPSLPENYTAIIDALENPHTSGKEIAHIISKDVAMTSELLKLANSSYFSRPQTILDIMEAVSMIGFETIRALIFKVGIFRQYQGNQRLRETLIAANKCSMSMNKISSRIAEQYEMTSEEKIQLMTASILCNIGTIVLLDQCPDDFTYCRRLLTEGMDLAEAETKAFGATHAEVSAYLLGLWGFNYQILELVAYHETPGLFKGEEAALLSCLHIAWSLSPHCATHDVSERKLDMDFLQQIDAFDESMTQPIDLQ